MTHGTAAVNPGHLYDTPVRRLCRVVGAGKLTPADAHQQESSR
jgi:hypothetical protein